MNRKGRRVVSFFLWVLTLFIGLAALLSFIITRKHEWEVFKDKPWLWNMIVGSSSWIHVAFFLILAILMIHHSLGLQAGVIEQMRKTLGRNPRILIFISKIYLFLVCAISLDDLTQWVLSVVSPQWETHFVQGTEFFRIIDGMHFQPVAIGALILFGGMYCYGYLKSAPWERRVLSGNTTIIRKSRLNTTVVRKLRKAERFVEKGKRYRAARIFEKLGDEYAFRAGMLFQEAGRFEKAKKAFSRAGWFYRKIKRPERAADAFFNAEDWSEAVRVMEPLLEAAKDDLSQKQSLINKCGEALYQLGDYRAAGDHYMKTNLFLQAASSYEKAGMVQEAGKAYSMAGDHEKSFKLLSEEGVPEMADAEKARWLLSQGLTVEAARCFESCNLFAEAGEAYESSRLVLAAAQAFQKAGKLEKAAMLFIEIGDDESAIDCYTKKGEYKKAADLAAYVGLQDRQGELYRKAGDFLAAMRSFYMIGDIGMVRKVAQLIDLNKDRAVEETLEIFETLIQNNRAKDAMAGLEACLENKEITTQSCDMFLIMARMKRRLGYKASAAEILIQLANQFPDRQDIAKEAVEASKETGIPFRSNKETQNLSLTMTQRMPPERKRKKERIENTATQTFDEDMFLDLTSEGKLGRFELIKEIARGGMGIVYKARDRRLDRMVAFKMLHPEFNQDPKTVLFFKREARFVAQLNHPAIVTLFDVGYQKGCFYLVMEYVDGVTLSHLLRKYPNYIRSNFLALWYEAALGLLHAHESGVLHRDIKPSNIMITKDRHVKVMDFGLAKNAAESSNSDQAWGTPAFLAPELVEHRKASFQSDIYSLGATFYLMATGEVPFKKDESHLRLKSDGLPTSPAEIVPGMSPDLARTILKCLYRDPKERYRSVKELLTAIKLLGNMKVKLFP